MPPRLQWRGRCEDYDGFALAALHVITTLTGSVLLALAHARGRLTAEQAWAAAHVDEDWQISKWGEDAEAKARREGRWADMQAASRMLGLVCADGRGRGCSHEEWAGRTGVARAGGAAW